MFKNKLMKIDKGHGEARAGDWGQVVVLNRVFKKALNYREPFCMAWGM